MLHPFSLATIHRTSSFAFPSLNNLFLLLVFSFRRRKLELNRQCPRRLQCVAFRRRGPPPPPCPIIPFSLPLDQKAVRLDEPKSWTRTTTTTSTTTPPTTTRSATRLRPFLKRSTREERKSLLLDKRSSHGEHIVVQSPVHSFIHSLSIVYCADASWKQDAVEAECSCRNLE